MELAAEFNEDYYERGTALGISGYSNYTWLPELTIPMAHHIVKSLGIEQSDRVLDYGCAKGYLVKALALLGIDAYGFDVSEYAISQVPTEVKSKCKCISNFDALEYELLALAPYNKKEGWVKTNYLDWLLSKDVWEHIPEKELGPIVRLLADHCANAFVVVPLARENDGPLIIDSYNHDITHVTRKTKGWWLKFLQDNGWDVDTHSNEWKGLKENWTKPYPDGNGFFLLRSTEL